MERNNSNNLVNGSRIAAVVDIIVSLIFIYNLTTRDFSTWIQIFLGGLVALFLLSAKVEAKKAAYQDRVLINMCFNKEKENIVPPFEL